MGCFWGAKVPFKRIKMQLFPLNLLFINNLLRSDPQNRYKNRVAPYGASPRNYGSRYSCNEPGFRGPEAKEEVSPDELYRKAFFSRP